MTYKAILHGNQLEWLDPPPPADDGVEVQVLLREPRKTNSREAVIALRRIAARGGVRSIPDPVAWQREIREDRPLPGRD